ncbi:putative endonuclease [Handroanthus impetiginosus]|uniref:Putative endonuclease n=1 Tax=Handroanthus impetiginosus TaxID=429701 RepID=A0A2G9GW37_9LAMI|nr:putative endonuclease [Handroanthus impetiginosus]
MKLSEKGFSYCALLPMSMEQEPSTSENNTSLQLLNEWIEIQDSLKERLITEDGFSWKVPPIKEVAQENQDSHGGEILKYVGGVDLSFSKDDPSIACAALVVLDFSTLEVVYEDSAIVELRIPYVPGFLAFREAPVLLELLERMKKTALPLYPQVLMVDGNGLLHPRGKSFSNLLKRYNNDIFATPSDSRLFKIPVCLDIGFAGFGLACHLGVMADLPTIGIGKNATRSTEGSLKPIFISVGHRISLASAVKIVKSSCRFRVPEPTRPTSDQKIVFASMA